MTTHTETPEGNAKEMEYLDTLIAFNKTDIGKLFVAFDAAAAKVWIADFDDNASEHEKQRAEKHYQSTKRALIIALYKVKS